jgi:protoheme IX farnesyltransferase
MISIIAVQTPSMPREAVLSPEEPPLPGPWLRLAAIGAAVATGAVIAAATMGHKQFHDLLSLIALAFLAVIAIASVISYPALRRPVGVAVGAMLVQIALGGLIALSGRGPVLHVAHIAVAAVAFAATLAVAVRVRWDRTPQPSTWRDYLTLTKPRIMSLLLLTALCGMFVAAEGVPSAGLIVATMAGLALACGGASALNHYMDRDIDIHMSRTDGRPVATGRVAPERALEFGLTLSALSFVLLACTTNLLTAVLAIIGDLFYVVVYTGYLKRRTAQNIVIGGAAGAVPPLVGYAAVSGDLTWTAALLFLIVFVWTPPHFWALAMLIKDDYKAAGIPMLPVVRGDAETTRQIVRYTFLMIAVTLLPIAFGMGWFYAVSALLLGAVFLWMALALRKAVSRHAAKVLFHYSLLYLALLFVAMAADAVI